MPLRAHHGDMLDNLTGIATKSMMDRTLQGARGTDPVEPVRRPRPRTRVVSRRR